jgi:hypothetical protein
MNLTENQKYGFIGLSVILGLALGLVLFFIIRHFRNKTGNNCVKKCNDKTCGDDGCNGSCGTCSDGKTCDISSGKCICVPNCDGKECGDDGCTGSCGTCSEAEGKTCDISSGKCISNQDGYEDGEDIFYNKCNKGKKCANPKSNICFNPTKKIFSCEQSCSSTKTPDCIKNPPKDPVCKQVFCGSDPSDDCTDSCGVNNNSGKFCPCNSTCCANGFSCNTSGKCVQSNCYGEGEDPFNGNNKCDGGNKLKCCGDLSFCKVGSGYKCKTKVDGDICQGDSAFKEPNCSDLTMTNCKTSSVFCPQLDKCYNEGENPFSTQGQTPCQKGIKCCNDLLFCGTKNINNSYTYTCNTKCESPSIQITNEMPQMPTCSVNKQCKGSGSQFCKL